MKYILEKYKGTNSRYNCPNCNGFKSFSKYIDTETNEYLNDYVGRCNKVDKCGYHFKPKQFFDNNKQYSYLTNTRARSLIKTHVLKQMFTIPIEHLDATLTSYHLNNFAFLLNHYFGYDAAVKLLTLYEIGTSKMWRGANIFWQIDVSGVVRTGKIMLYNVDTFKRVKQPYDHINWVHKGLINLDTYELKQCFFGEHLINQFKSKPIAIVESEKTAVICSHYLPEYNWLGAGNINGLSIEKFKVLEGRKVVLFPDLNKGYAIWKQKVNEFKNIAEVSISDYLERIATPLQKINGLDLADYLLNYNKKQVA